MDNLEMSHGEGRAEGPSVRRAPRRATDGVEEIGHEQRGRWDKAGARESLLRHVMAHLASPDGVLVLDEADFVKESGRCVGVQKVASVLRNSVEHRQTGVFLAYAGRGSYGYVDRELFLPRAWAEQESLRRACGIPADVEYATRPQMARRMLARALVAGIPHRWIACASGFGGDAGLRMWLEERHEAYVMRVSGREIVRTGQFAHRIDPLVAAWPRDAWLVSRGDDSESRLWAGVQIDCHAGVGWERWLLASRRSMSDDQLLHHIAFAPRGSSFDAMISALSCCRRVADGMQDARRLVGLDRFAGQSWDGWYRHMTVALLAYAVLCASRSAPPGFDAVDRSRRLPARPRWSAAT